MSRRKQKSKFKLRPVVMSKLEYALYIILLTAAGFFLYKVFEAVVLKVY